MTDTEIAEHVIRQGKALVRAIEALGTTEPSGWFERWQVQLLVAAYKHRLRAIGTAVPDWPRIGSGGADCLEIGSPRTGGA